MKHSKSLSSSGVFLASLPVVISLFLAVIAVLTTAPPNPKGLDTAANEFSAQRAFVHIEEVFQHPHMTGTLEHERVCSYIASELEKLGLEVDVQTTTAINQRGLPIFANVTNVVGRIKGTNSSKSVMVVGHYDTQPHTPGAADDGIAVGSMLEAASIIVSQHKLANDIIFLFTDAEEVGLLGACAFADEHPWMQEVGLILNLEARGNSGAAFAFELSPENGWIVKEMAKGIPRAYAGSMMYEVYKMMPNDTDFTIFKNRGFSGINVAIVQGFVNYHSPTDSPENLSLASLQHMGSYVMGFATHFGNIQIDNTKSNDLVYFNVFGSRMVYFPSSWNVWLLAISVLLFAFFIFLGFARRKLRVGHILLSFFATLFSLAIVIGLIWLINLLIKGAYPHYSVFYSSNFYNSSWYFFAYISIAISAFCFLYYVILRRLNIFSVLVSIHLLFIIITVFILLNLPTASYLTLVPLLLSQISIILILFFDIDRDKKPFMYHLIILLGLTPFVFMISPYVYLVFHIFGLNLPIAAIGLLCLLLLMALPFIETSLTRLKHQLSIAALILGVAFLVVAHTKSSPSESRPLQSNVMYASLNEQGKAFWLSSNHRTDEWNNQFFEGARVEAIDEFYPKRNKPFLKAEAEFMEFEKPLVDILSEFKSDTVSSVEFLLRSSIDPVIVELLVPFDLNVRSVTVNGKRANMANSAFNQQRGYHLVRLTGPNPIGDKYSIEYESTQPINFTIIEKKLGIPQFNFIKPMPSHIIPDTDYESYMTLVKNNISL